MDVNRTILVFEISHNARNPPVEVIHTSTNVSNAEASIKIRLNPKLVALIKKILPSIIAKFTGIPMFAN